MELYYAIMNILDYMALNEISKDIREDLYKFLDYLFNLSDFESINDIASANDCGDCNTWGEIVKELKELFASGGRVKL